MLIQDMDTNGDQHHASENLDISSHATGAAHHPAKMKTDNGADFVITQLFFDNMQYFDYVARLRILGVTARVIPGILPITNYASLIKFCELCGATITDELKKIFEPIADDAQATLEAGIEFAIRQCVDLLDGGAPGLHFYCLNKSSPTDQILVKVRPSEISFG